MLISSTRKAHDISSPTHYHEYRLLMYRTSQRPLRLRYPGMLKITGRISTSPKSSGRLWRVKMELTKSSLLENACCIATIDCAYHRQPERRLSANFTTPRRPDIPEETALTCCSNPSIIGPTCT